MKWYESLILAVAFSVVFAGGVAWLAPERIYDTVVMLEILIAVLALHSAIEWVKGLRKKAGRKLQP